MRLVDHLAGVRWVKGSLIIGAEARRRNLCRSDQNEELGSVWIHDGLDAASRCLTVGVGEADWEVEGERSGIPWLVRCRRLMTCWFVFAESRMWL